MVADDGKTWNGLATRLNLTSPFKMGFQLQTVNRLFPTVERLPEVLPLEDISFEGPLIHRSVPECIGYPRSDFFIGRDDMEYAIRALRSGLGPILLVRDAEMKRLLEPVYVYPLWRQYYQWRNELIIRSSHWAHPLMRIRVRMMFVLRTLYGFLSRKDSPVITRMRSHAFFDSVSGKPLTNRYLPGNCPMAETSTLN